MSSKGPQKKKGDKAVTVKLCFSVKIELGENSGRVADCLQLLENNVRVCQPTVLPGGPFTPLCPLIPVPGDPLSPFSPGKPT